MSRFGILTSGGDCPGLNAVIRGVVIRANRAHNSDIVGFRKGWRGVFDRDVVSLDRESVRGLTTKGGTILGTSRTNPVDAFGGAPEVQRVLDELRLDGVIAIGGEGTLSAATRLADAGIHIVGVPKTIDNDLSATDYSFGFDTAVQIATDAMDRLRTTGESHERCMIAEVMGRHTGWIALQSGLAASAHAILIPEVPLSIDDVCAWVTSCRDGGRMPLVVVAEGFTVKGSSNPYGDRGLDSTGRTRLGGIGDILAPLIEARTGIETRATILGHIQRGGIPTAFDRALSTRLGMAAIDAAVDGDWGSMVALRGTNICRVPLAEATGELHTVPVDRYDEVAILFG